MPLVPLEVVKKWYKKDSFVYKQFLFLFVNPLWVKTVPQGFSLCPYFWMSMFSLCLLRPIVGFMVLFGLAIKKLPIKSIIGFTDSIANKIPLCRNDGDELGRKSALVLLLSALTGGIISLITALAILLYEEGVLFILLNALVLTVTLVACKAYADAKKYDDDACQVQWYVRGMVLVCLAIAFGCYRDAAVTAFLHYPVDFVIGVGGMLWLVVSTVFIGCIDGAVWLGSGVWYLVTGSIMYALLGVAFIILTAAMGYAAQYLPVKVEEAKPEKKDEEQEAMYSERMTASEIYCRDHKTRMSSDAILAFCKKYLLAEFTALRKVAEDVDAVRAFVEVMAAEEEKQNARKRAAEALRKAKCRKATAMVKKVLHPFHACFIKPLLFCLKTVGVFLCLVWELVKARKQGACPYIRFEK